MTVSCPWASRPSAVDGGRILNPKTARSQIIGGIVGGIGMALLEETVSDRTGRLVNTSLGDYVIAANADVPDIDVLFVGGPDAMTPVGTKGIGELSITGMAAAIANAVYHATGTRIRSLPSRSTRCSISVRHDRGHPPGLLCE
jgi:CO/xanthine dehydrogenase Mo-binding subunit